MMKLKRLFNLTRIILSSLLSKALPKRGLQKIPDVILVVFGGVIGDSLLFSDALKTLDDFYGEKGKKIVLVCNIIVERFLKSVRKDITVTFRSFDADKILYDYGYFRAFIDGLKNARYELLIAPFQSKRAELIALNVQAENKIGVYAEFRSKTSPAYWLNYIAYAESIIVPSNNFAWQNYRELFRYLGNDLPRWKMASLSEFGSVHDFKNHKPYCIICPSGSESVRIWELEKFYGIIDYLTEETTLNIYICAGDEACGLFEKITSSIKHPERLCDYIGKMSFTDWIELIRNAKFCFGNDTASVHIAAFTGTIYMALVSGHAYGNCVPYNLLNLNIEKNSLSPPICIYRRKECFGCLFIGGKGGVGNNECKKNVRKNGRYLCIEDISVDDAISVLQETLAHLNLRHVRCR
jgi:ADP-heptose:LPS heptosyltransferase